MKFNFKYFRKHLFVLLFFISCHTFAQTISPTNGLQVGNISVPCSDCVPIGWTDNGGTPDVSNRTNAATSETSGGGATWTSTTSSSNDLILPLPPNSHETWLSLRDLGTAGIEESVNTTIGGLTVGRTYELVVYSLTAVTRSNGFNGNNFVSPYAGTYIDQFFVDVAGQTLAAGNLTQNTWGTSRLRFIANQTSHVMVVRPGANAASNGFNNSYETVQVSVTLNAVNAVPIAVADNVTTSQNTPVAISVFTNDSDPDGSVVANTVRFANNQTSVVVPNQGTWSVNTTTGMVTFTPIPTFLGTATISYTIKDNYTLDGITNPSTSNSANISVTVIVDADGDGIANSADLDDDNDGILDTAEGCSSTVTMASLTAGALTTLNNTGTTVFPLVPSGATLPNNGVTFTRTSGANTWGSSTPAIATTTANINGVTTAPFSTTYLDLLGTVPRVFTIDFGTSANALSTVHNTYQYIIGIAGLGGENTAVTNTFSVPLTVASNSNVFNTNLYSLLNGAVAASGATGTVFSTNTPLTTTQGYTFFLVPTSVASLTMTLSGANDPHGIIFGVYNADCRTDADGDIIPNYLDVDSDGDGCADAVEGSENVTYSMVNPLTATNPGQINVRFNGTTAGTPSQIISTSTAANGVPQLVNNAANNTNVSIGLSSTAGVADNTGSSPFAGVGQAIGNSLNSALSDCKCYRNPTTTLGTDNATIHGITAFNRAGAGNTNWPMIRNNGWTALEANTKAFVMNRMPVATATVGTTVIAGEPVNASNVPVISTPVIGMTFYDTSNNCMKVNVDGTRTGWKCFNTQSCPQEN